MQELPKVVEGLESVRYMLACLIVWDIYWFVYLLGIVWSRYNCDEPSLKKYIYALSLRNDTPLH